MRIAHLRQRLRDLGAKPCHEDRLLRGWLQASSYSGSISKVKQDGDEQTTQKTAVSANANFACEVKPEWVAEATVQVARTGVSEEANAVHR
jgi:hypothetical protein